MIEIKSTPGKQYDIYVDLAENIDKETLLAMCSPLGEQVPNTVKVKLNGKEKKVELHDYWSCTLDELSLFNSFIKLCFDFDAIRLKELFRKKYPGRARKDSNIAFVLYRIPEEQTQTA